ncbi:hypothetical protein PR202_ga03756 [Eleusine coracana subsp. coracana]|uniref:Uncharacterized protein n=1 Tax=Eleusine coracana subsp. coracana TaxID=191504 RepID=A0AAV5BN49_ELECO|nr:hypothetical protein PR202_ga03756 [Eleusine coracana subsp. coracana]
MAEEFAKAEQQSVGIEQLLKQLLDETSGQRLALAKIEDAMKSMKASTQENAKRIGDLEKKVAEPPPLPQILASFPPPSSNRQSGGKSHPTLEKRVDPLQPASGLYVETRNRGNVEGILGVP